jgi:hypothetical protein
MPPKKDLKSLLGQKSPTELRKGIQQIDILQEAAAALTPVSSEKETEISDIRKEGDIQTEETDIKSEDELQIGETDKKEVEKKSVKSSDRRRRTTKSRIETERINRSQTRKKPHVFSQKDVQAVLAIDKRQTERYSFEIFSDQKDDIQQICDLYEAATGKKLSASRLIREVLDTFLPDALKTFQSAVKETSEE